MKPLLPILMLPLLMGCAPMTESTPVSRPMDEVPAQRMLPDGNREYGFTSGCVIVLEPRRAVVKAESGPCQLHHRDIALLYAAAD